MYKRNGLRALGLSILAALGLMAFTASAAQAGGGVWLDLTGALPTPITGEQTGTENRLLILGLNILLKCEEVEVVGTTEIEANGHGKGELSFAGCYFTDLSLNKNTICNVEVLNAQVLALLVKHNSHGYVLFSPVAPATTFTQAHATSTPGNECLLPKLPVVKGSVVAKIATNPGTHAASHSLTTVGTLTLFTSDKLFYGANEAHLEVNAEVSLAAGGSWGYDLN